MKWLHSINSVSIKYYTLMTHIQYWVLNNRHDASDLMNALNQTRISHLVLYMRYKSETSFWIRLRNIESISTLHIYSGYEWILDLKPLLVDNYNLQRLILDSDYYYHILDVDLTVNHLSWLECHVLCISRMHELLASLTENHTLRTLTLSNIVNDNAIRITSTGCLENLTLKATQPTILYLPDNFYPVKLHLTYIHATTMSPALFGCLKHLFLENIDLSCSEFMEICLMVQNSQILTRLYLTFVADVSADMCQAFYQAIQHHQSLEILRFVNDTYDDIPKKICHYLALNKNLQHLSLGIQKIVGAKRIKISVPQDAISALAHNYCLQSFQFLPYYLTSNTNVYRVDKSIVCSEIETIMIRNRRQYRVITESLRVKAARIFRTHYETWPNDLIPSEVNDLLAETKNLS